MATGDRREQGMVVAEMLWMKKDDKLNGVWEATSEPSWAYKKKKKKT